MNLSFLLVRRRPVLAVLLFRGGSSLKTCSQSSRLRVSTYLSQLALSVFLGGNRAVLPPYGRFTPTGRLWDTCHIRVPIILVARPATWLIIIPVLVRFRALWQDRSHLLFPVIIRGGNILMLT